MSGHSGRFRQATPVVLLGARGRAGRMHRKVYDRLGVPVCEVDLVDNTLQHWKYRVPWQDAVVDVCTPTAEHTWSMRWAYECGARNFLVEKPTANSLAEWLSALAELTECRVLGVQNYLFSRAFGLARAELPEVYRITSSFNRFRADDDTAGRGADLPHVVAVEMPHQFAMALSVCPDLRVTGVTEHAFGNRGSRQDVAVACSVHLTGRGVTAVLSSNLRAPRQRWIRLHSADGRYVHCDFPAATGASRAYKRDERGVVTSLFGGDDDMLRVCLSAALRAFASNEVPPPELSVDLVTSVGRCVDDALSTVGPTTVVTSPVAV